MKTETLLLIGGGIALGYYLSRRGTSATTAATSGQAVGIAPAQMAAVVAPDPNAASYEVDFVPDYWGWGTPSWGSGSWGGFRSGHRGHGGHGHGHGGHGGHH